MKKINFEQQTKNKRTIMELITTNKETNNGKG